MANNFNKILELVNAGNQMGLSNTIKRDYGIPLDFTSVQESYDAAIVYAATNTLAYVGQTVAVGGKLYIITDVANGTYSVGEGEEAKTYNNYLAEVGSKTESDGNTIEFDGQILKLAGLTGLDSNKTYVPSYVGGKLIWAEPDTSTTDGQAAAIAALDARAATLETVINGKRAVGEEGSEGYIPAVKGLVDYVADNAQVVIDEKAAREAADLVLESKITEALQAAMDYADANDTNTIYDDTKVKADIEQNAASIAALSDNVYTKTEIDTKVNTITEVIEDVNSTIAGITHFATKIVDSIDDVTETGILYLIKDELVTGDDKYNEYLVIDNVAVLIGDTTTNLSDYVLNDTFDAALAACITSSSLSETLKDYAKVADINTTLADYAKSDDVITNNTFETFKAENSAAIANACTEAVAEVSKVGYALAADVAAELGKKIESGSIVHSSEALVEGVTVEGPKLNIVVDAYTKQETRDYIAKIIEGMTGGESDATVLAILNDHIATYEAKVSQIDANDAAHDAVILAVQSQADQGIADAKAVNEALAALVTTGQVHINTDDIATVKAGLSALEGTTSGYELRISATETGIASLEAAINKLPAVNLQDYAKSEDVDAALAAKANSADVYTIAQANDTFIARDEVNSKINDLIAGVETESGKTIENIQDLVKLVDSNAGKIAVLVTAVDGYSSTIEIHDAAIAALNDVVADMRPPKSSDEISIDTDGTLGINEVNVNKLVQITGDTLILNGGASSLS